MNIYLTDMNKELFRQYMQEFSFDPDIFADMRRFSQYQYDEGRTDAQWERNQRLGRKHLAIMLDDEPIGEIIFKEINLPEHRCTLSVH